MTIAAHRNLQVNSPLPLVRRKGCWLGWPRADGGPGMSWHQCRITVFIVTVVLSVGNVGTPASATGSDRNTVIAQYQQIFEPALTVSTGSTASLETCVRGTTSAENQAATLAALNYLRGLAGLRPVKINQAMNRKAQAAALIMSANSALTHWPTKTMKCYSKDGFDAANRGNLILGQPPGANGLAWGTGSRAVLGYFQDQGPNNVNVGHRRWLLWQGLTEVGSGDTSNANVIYLPSPRRTSGTWVSWPTAGFFPRELEPYGRWSLSYPNASFAQARVKMLGPDGESIKLRQYPATYGTGDNTLVWDATLPAIYYEDLQKDFTFSVAVTGIRLPTGKTVSRKWQTTLVAAAATEGWEAYPNNQIQGLPVPIRPGAISQSSGGDSRQGEIIVGYLTRHLSSAACLAPHRAYYARLGWTLSDVLVSADGHSMTATKGASRLEITAAASPPYFCYALVEFRV